MNDTTDKGAGEQTSEANYEVLARKYRPQNFDDLIGHEAMVRTLENAFTAGRIAHAYILTGVRGVGKTTTARILARALNYVPKQGADTGPQIHMHEDGVHCSAIAQSRHPDVMEMDAASRTGVGDIRELIEGVRYAPIEARYKVYIIDEVHMLSTAAFNALLKTLEEPPPHVKFIFATTEIRKLPVTVLSRCQRFDLRRIDPEALVAHLEKIARLEQVSVDAEGLAIIARAAEGSVRDALSILDQAIVQQGVASNTSNAVSARTIQDMLGLADRSQSWDLIEACLAGKAADGLSLYKTQYDHGADPVVILRDLLELVHLLTRTKAAGPAAANHGPAGAADAKRAIALSQGLSMNALTRAWSLLMKGLEETRVAPDAMTAGEMALIRLCYAADLPTPDEAIRMLKAGGFEGGNSPGAPISSKQPSTQAISEANGQMAMQKSATEHKPETKPDAKPAGIQEKPFRPFLVEGAGTGPTMRASNSLTSLKDIADLARKNRDIRLCTELEAHMRVISFAPPSIVMELVDNAPGDLPNRLMRNLKLWTGDHWTITEDSQVASEQTLRDRRLEEVRTHPMVEKALALFPGATIHKIREPLLPDAQSAPDPSGDEGSDLDNNDESDEGPGPTTQQPKEAYSP